MSGDAIQLLLPDGTQGQMRGNQDGTISVSGARITTPVTISNGTSLSNGADLGSGTLSAIVMPAAWTTAGLSFAVSIDNVTFQQLNNPLTGEYTVPSAAVAASVTIQLPLSDFMPFRYIKIRSGTAGSPVTQGADRILTLIYNP